MPTTYSVSAADVLHDGSEYSIGYASNRNERSQRVYLVETDDTAGTASGAAAAVYSANSSESNISGIPLDHAAVTRIGPRKWLVTQRFSWQSAGHWGGSSVTTVCDFRLRTEWVPCYTVGTPESDGLPATSADWFSISSQYDPTVEPMPYMFPKAVIHIRIPFRSNTNPMTSTVAGLVNKVNNASVTFLASNASSVTFGANTVKFIGADITGRANASYIFVGSFDFLASASWKVMTAKFTSGAWAATKTLNLATGDFNTAFGI